MTLEQHTRAIVRLAWERRFGFPDGSLDDDDALQQLCDDGATSLTFLRLWGGAALVGPGWALEEAQGCTPEELADHATLLRVTRSRGGHGLGTASLFYADDLPLVQPPEEVTLSREPGAASLLEERCPPDDIHEVHLSGMDHTFTLLDGETPVACGAYAEWQGIVAQLGVLVSPELRARGLGTLAASVAAQEALASGLVLQARADVSNFAANALARRLGLSWAGTQTSVLLAR
ncbi:MAG: family N-acetyltransferase [Micrococcaceae bacterium]|nr:family N-acetyltransferase [Micrococcaceae bacterium]